MARSLDLHVIRQTLEAEYAIVRDQIERTEARLRSRIDSTPDHLDLAQESVSRERRAVLLTRAQQQLARIETALQRLAEGAYEWCAGCGESIPAARLEVLPYASLCVRCQAQHEQVGQSA